MTSARQKCAVGIFPDRPTTASALQALQDGGFSTDQITVIAKDARQQDAIAGVPVYNRLGNRAGSGAVVLGIAGGVLGSVAGLLVGWGSVSIPGITPLIDSHPQVTGTGSQKVTLTTLGGGTAGLAVGGVLGFLFGLGMPYDRAKGCRDRIERGEYVLMLYGNKATFQRARSTLLQLNQQDAELTQVPLLPPPQLGNGSVPDGADRPAIAPHSPTVLSNRSTVPAAPIEPILSTPQDAPSPASSLPLPQSIAAANHSQEPALQAAVAQAESPSIPRRSPPRPPAHISFPPVKDAQKVGAQVAQKSEKRAIAIFPNTHQMETALSALRHANFPMHRLSIVMPDPDFHPEPPEANGDEAHPAVASSVARGGSFGGITGLMLGLERLIVPGSGRFLVAGAEASLLTASLAGSVPTSLAGSLMGMGIPETEARGYGDRLGTGACLVMVRGTGEETLHLASIFNQQGIQDWSIYANRG